MTGTAIGTAIGQEQCDEAIAEALTAGRSLRAVRKEFGLSTAELDSALERLWPIDAVARLRMIKSDLGKLDRLTQVFYEKALGGCIQSGLLTVRIWERKHELLGMNAAAKFEVVTAPPEAVPRHERIREAIMRLTEQPPVRRAAIERIDQLGPEKALEMLGSPQSNNGSGSPPDASNAVDALADAGHSLSLSS